MNSNDIVNIVKGSLGFPAVQIEVEDALIESYLSMSVAKISELSDFSKHITVPALPCQNFDLGTVIQVYNNDSSSIYEGSTDSDYLFDETKTVVYTNGNYTRSRKDVILSQVSKNLNSNLVNRAFKQIDNQLYIYNMKGNVTIEYLPKETTFDDLDNNLKDWCFRYTLALTKEAVGRIRSKYKSTSSPFELDGDTLLNEGTQEKQQLIDELSEKGYGYFCIEYD